MGEPFLRELFSRHIIFYSPGTYQIAFQSVCRAKLASRELCEVKCTCLDGVVELLVLELAITDLQHALLEAALPGHELERYQ